jgi:hypothetical protein
VEAFVVRSFKHWACCIGWAAAFLVPALSGGADSQDVLFNGSSLKLEARLSDEESHTIYQTVGGGGSQICHKKVLVGYEKECHWEPNQVCHNEPHQECGYTSHPVCHTEYEQVCNTTNHQVCGYETKHECQTNTRPVCHTEYRPVCWDEEKEVCTGGGQPVCQTVHECNNVPPPHTVCWDKEVCTGGQPSCHTVTEHKCNNESHEVCHDEPSTVCHDTQEYVCHNEPQSSCHNEPHQVCENEQEYTCHTTYEPVCSDQGHNVCEQVPQYEDQEYECGSGGGGTTVPVGEELDFRVNAVVKLNFTQTSSPTQPAEKFVATLDGTKPGLKLAENTRKYVIVAVPGKVDVKIVQNDLGPNRPGIKQVTASYDVAVLPPADLDNAIQGITKIGIREKKVSFRLGGRLHLTKALSLKVKIDRIAGQKRVPVVNATIPWEKLEFATAVDGKTAVAAALKPYLLEPLKKAKYAVSIEANYQPRATPEVLNPELIPAGMTAKTSAEAVIQLKTP